MRVALFALGLVPVVLTPVPYARNPGGWLNGILPQCRYHNHTMDHERINASLGHYDPKVEPKVLSRFLSSQSAPGRAPGCLYSLRVCCCVSCFRPLPRALTRQPVFLTDIMWRAADARCFAACVLRRICMDTCAVFAA